MRLADEFPRERVHWRVQGKPIERQGKHYARALAYIDARDVMDRLDEVVGPDGWQTEITETASGRVICRLGIRLDGEWVWKADGAGDTAVEGEKGGISDAFKRAAVHWGIGRYLYRLPAPWVACKVRNGKWAGWEEDPWAKVGEKPAVVDAEQFVKLRDLIEMTNTDISKFLGHFGVRTLNDFPSARYAEAMTMLEKKRAGMAGSDDETNN